jgi:hypothetical protein
VPCVDNTYVKFVSGDVDLRPSGDLYAILVGGDKARLGREK